jgi:hypothetical protein
MKYSPISVGLIGLLALAGCAGVTAQRGDCDAMLHTERENCLRANESNRQILSERAKEKRAADKPSGEFGKKELESEREE